MPGEELSVVKLIGVGDDIVLYDMRRDTVLGVLGWESEEEEKELSEEEKEGPMDVSSRS